MHRFFADENEIDHGTACLNIEDSRHALRVLRLATGDEIELVCAPGRCLAQITGETDGLVQVKILQALRQTEARTQVTLYQGLPKADKMEMIAQKTTELGVYAIRPVAMERCVVKLDGKDMGARMERYNRVAYEAAKQSKRGRIPRVREVASLDGCDFSSYDDVFVAYECERELTLKTALDEKRPKSAALIIGPEGGFEPEEVAALEKKGARTITLGNRILRTETAGMAATAMMLCLLEG